MKNKIFKKFNIFVLVLSLLFSNISFAASNVIYAPTTVNNDIAIDSSATNNALESEIIYGLAEDASAANYISVFNIVEDNDNYYCYDNGQYVKNAWRKISKWSYAQFAPTDYFPNDYIWAYFGSNGRAIKAASGKVRRVAIGSNTYAFNEYGQMLQGYFNDSAEMWDIRSEEDPFYLISDDNNLYYASEVDGTLVTGWHKFLGTTSRYPNKNTIWIYFNKSNFRAVRSTSANYKKQAIDGMYYAFDNYGVMLTGFEAYQYNVNNGGNTSSIPYFSEDGSEVVNDFINVNAFNSDEEYYDELDYEDYDYEDIVIYLNKSGVMYKNIIKKVGSNYYGFDDKGVLLRGLTVWNGSNYVATIDVEDTDGKSFIVNKAYIDKNGVRNTISSNETVHYFDTSTGKRITNTIKLEFSDGEYTYYASNLGGYNGSHNKKYYVNGLLVKPTDGVKYGLYIYNPSKTTYTMSEAINAGAVVVNSNGTIVSSTSGQKDENDYYWLLNGSTLVNVYSVNVRKQNGSYQFRGYNNNGGESWYTFGDKDSLGRTCVTNVTTNGTRLSSGATSSFQVKLTNENALNFFIK